MLFALFLLICYGFLQFGSRNLTYMSKKYKFSIVEEPNIDLIQASLTATDHERLVHIIRVRQVMKGGRLGKAGGYLFLSVTSFTNKKSPTGTLAMSGYLMKLWGPDSPKREPTYAPGAGTPRGQFHKLRSFKATFSLKEVEGSYGSITSLSHHVVFPRT